MTDVADIVRESKEGFEALVIRAFEAGREIGRKEATVEMKSRMFSMFDSSDRPSDTDAIVPGMISKQDETTSRATPGSIKPRIEQLLKDNPNGLTKKEIVERTGFKENTVRGTLWTLGQERFADHDSGRWFVRKEKGPSTEPEDSPFS